MCFAKIERVFLQMDMLFFVAIAIIFGFIGGKLAHWLKLPGIVGYLIAGLILGPSVLNVFKISLLDNIGGKSTTSSSSNWLSGKQIA